MHPCEGQVAGECKAGRTWESDESHLHAPGITYHAKRSKRFVSRQIDGKQTVYLLLRKAKNAVDGLAVRHDKLTILSVFHPGAIRLFPKCDLPHSGRLEVS